MGDAVNLQRRIGTLLLAAGLAVFSDGTLSATLAAPTQDVSADGRCVGVDFDREAALVGAPSGVGRSIRVLDGEAKATAARDGSGPQMALEFNQRLFVTDVGTDRDDPKARIGVRRIGYENETWWTERGSLLCQLDAPMRAKNSGLERKILVRTAVSKQGDADAQFVKARTYLADRPCGNDCRDISRFALYFVYAETATHVLISFDLNLKTSGNDAASGLVGWIPKENVIEWPWAVGLRPREDLRFKDAMGEGAGAICAFATLDDARAKKDCLPVLGGMNWFLTENRLNVLSVRDGFYEVAAPVSGTRERDSTVSDTSIRIDPAVLRGANVEDLKVADQIDVFFVLDATSSMTPFIDAIRGTAGRPGVVQQIAHKLRAKFAQGATLRFGFRVYRDSTAAGTSGIGEGLPLPDVDEQTCRSRDPAATKANHESFLAEIAKVRVAVDERDDFAENSLGGIQATIDDLKGCPKNTKLVFVIGDAGYDAAAQAARRQPTIAIDRLAENIASTYKGAALFFIRPPNDAPRVKNPHAYLDAWNLFGAQAFEILSLLPAQRDQASSYFFDLPNDLTVTASMLDTITSYAENLTQPAALNDVIIDVRGGMSLEKAIERISRQRQDVSVLYWKLLANRGCEALGSACTKSIYQGVANMFIPVDAPVELDVWMSDYQLQDWGKFLATALQQDQDVTTRRLALVSALAVTLQDIVKTPSYEDTRETIVEFLARAGWLPQGLKTPLLGYSIGELADPSVVRDCELLLLFDWLDAARLMLRTVQATEFLADVRLSTQKADSRCPTISAKGANLRLLDGQPQSRRVEMKYKVVTTMSKSRIFWVPLAYLP